MKYGFLIPVYNHGKSCYEEVNILLKHNLPIILVDDASNEETKEWLSKAKDLCPVARELRDKDYMKILSLAPEVL